MQVENEPVREPVREGVVDALQHPSAYPYDTVSQLVGSEARIEHLQTHLSHIFLTPERVYKLRKAVHLPFVDFGTRLERNTDCLSEVALNRRLAPDVYFGVASVRRVGGDLQVGPTTQTFTTRATRLEHVVVMRRLREADKALSRLSAGNLEVAHIDAIARRIADFHRDNALPVASEERKPLLLERTTRAVGDAFELAGRAAPEVIDPRRLATLRAATEGWFDENRALFEARIDAGRIVDGHGDLHLDHIYFESKPGSTEADLPIVIDCVEFNAELRCVDVASEMAFPAMDLRYRGRPDLAERLLRQYALESDDYDLYRVVDYFQIYRALVRGGVAAVASADPTIDEKQRSAARASASRHFELAETLLPKDRASSVILTAGSVGTGKSSAAEFLADRLNGVVVASDAVRKHLAGIELRKDAGEAWGEGIYDERWNDLVQRALLERARPVIESGRNVILDATFARRSARLDARRFAAEHELPIFLVHCRCDEETVRDRLRERKSRGGAVSDAGPDDLTESVSRFEALSDWSDADLLEIDTGRERWRERLEKALPRLQTGADESAGR